MICAPVRRDNKRGDYRPYRRTIHALSHLYHDIQEDHAHYVVSLAKD